MDGSIFSAYFRATIILLPLYLLYFCISSRQGRVKERWALHRLLFFLPVMLMLAVTAVPRFTGTLSPSAFFSKTVIGPSDTGKGTLSVSFKSGNVAEDEVLNGRSASVHGLKIGVIACGTFWVLSLPERSRGRHVRNRSSLACGFVSQAAAVAWSFGTFR